MGQSPDSSTYNTTNIGLPFYQGNADFGELYPKTRIWCSEPQKIAEPENILLSVRAPIGALNIAKEKCCIGRGLAAITPHKNFCFNKYLFYILKYKYNELNARGTGSTFKAINKSILNNLPIDIYSIDRQKRIAAILDKATELIALRKQQLEKLDLLVKSKFIEMFGDPMINPFRLPIIKLSSALAVEPQNGLYKPLTDYVSDNSGTPILRIDSFYNGKLFNIENLKRLICTEQEKQKYLLNEDDIIINRVNSIEYLGKCGHVKNLIEDTVFESNMMRFHMDEEKFDAVYVTTLLSSRFIYRQILNRAKKAVNQASINQEDVRSFEIYMPPLEKQKEFAAFVQKVDKSKSTLQQSLEKLELNYKALMQTYFG